jgi:hypothetical protein
MRTGIVITVAMLVSLLTGVAYAAPGDLDTSYGLGTGVSRPDFGGNEFGNAVALQPDGKIVVIARAPGAELFISSRPDS